MQELHPQCGRRQLHHPWQTEPAIRRRVEPFYHTIGVPRRRFCGRRQRRVDSARIPEDIGPSAKGSCTRSAFDLARRLATGSALGEVEARLAQFNAEGLRQVGSIRVIDVTQVEVETPETDSVRLEACLDATEIDVLDNSGASRTACTVLIGPCLINTS